MKELKNKVVLITGASKGIGKALCKKLLLAEAIVIATAREEKSFDDLKNEIEDTKDLFCYASDVSSYFDQERLYAKIKNSYGAVDILINNAGVATFKDFLDLTPEDFDAMVNTNFKGTFNTIKASLPDMIQHQKGIILNVLSAAIERSFEKSSVYSASKAAVRAMSRSLREEVRKDNIKVIDVMPGPTNTGIWDEKARELYNHNMMAPETLADSIVNILTMSLADNIMLEEIIIKPQLGDI